MSQGRHTTKPAARKTDPRPDADWTDADRHMAATQDSREFNPYTNYLSNGESVAQGRKEMQDWANKNQPSGNVPVDRSRHWNENGQSFPRRDSIDIGPIHVCRALPWHQHECTDLTPPVSTPPVRGRREVNQPPLSREKRDLGPGGN